MSRDNSFPSAAEGLHLHLRLLQQDASALADFLRAYLVPLRTWLERIYRRVDPHLREDAVEDVLIRYVKTPEIFDPRKLNLAAFLRMAARSKLFNHLRDEKRHRAGHISLQVVEKDPEAGYLSGREEDPALALEKAEEAGQWRDLLQTVMKNCTPEELRVLDLLLDGERQTKVFAAALGLEDRPEEEQEIEVKRVKDRLKKRLRRGGKHD